MLHRESSQRLEQLFRLVEASQPELPRRVRANDNVSRGRQLELEIAKQGTIGNPANQEPVGLSIDVKITFRHFDGALVGVDIRAGGNHVGCVGPGTNVEKRART